MKMEYRAQELRYNELTERSPRIFLSTEFDKKLQNDSGFKASIAGCTTLPLAWLRRDTGATQFFVDTYGAIHYDPPKGYINLNVHQDLKRVLLADSKDVIVDFFSLMRHDRRSMGFPTTAAVLYGRLVGLPLNQDYGFGNLINRELLALTLVYRQKRLMDLDRLLDETAIRLNHRYPRSKDEMKREVRDAFSSEQDFFHFLDLLKDRRGVQVIYGRRKALLEFIQSQDFEHIDDNGIKIFQPIPDELIIAVLPLGKYEQTQLASH